MSGALRALGRVRGVLPPPARRLVRRVTDPVLAPVGSVSGAVLPPGRDLVALTFDDGPDPEVTPRILDALAAAGAHATFFVLGDRAARCPDLVRRTAAEGHEIGLHGPDHRRLTTRPAADVAVDLARARHDLERLAGTEVRWFRPPFGSQSVRTFVAARRAGMTPVVWTAWGEDWVPQPAAQVIDRVRAGAGPGEIVLLHDGLAGDPREPAADDPLHDVRDDIVAGLLRRFDADGLRATTVGHLVQAGRARRTAWFRA